LRGEQDVAAGAAVHGEGGVEPDVGIAPEGPVRGGRGGRGGRGERGG
jgi:hypothetical protein